MPQQWNLDGIPAAKAGTAQPSEIKLTLRGGAAPPAPPKFDPEAIKQQIRTAAGQLNVPEDLALAIAEVESSFDPSAVGPVIKAGSAAGQQARGVFQMVPGTAARFNVTDPHDAQQNITGGLTYIRELLDRHGDDLDSALKEYGGVVTDTTYLPKVKAAQAKYGAAAAPVDPSQFNFDGIPDAPGGRGGGAGPGNVGRSGLGPDNLPGITDIALGAGRMAVSAVKGAASAFNPLTSEGRQNIAAGGGAILASRLTGGAVSPGMAMRLLQIAAPALGAGGAAGTEVAVEQALGADAYANDPYAAVKAGGLQGAMEAGGGMLLWPLKRGATALSAPGVAAASRAKLATAAETARETGRQAIAQAEREMAATTQVTRRATQQMVDQTVEAGAEHTARARRIAAEGAARVEAEGAQTLTDLTKQLDDITQAFPGRGQVASGQAVQSAIPALLKTAKIAGERVEAAALAGPALDITPVIATLKDRVNRALPESLYPRHEAVRGAGFLPAPSTIAKRRPGLPPGQIQMTEPEFQAFLKGETLKTADERLPLSGILDVVAHAPRQLSFADAHALKRLLDERVSWDKVAKRVNEGLTKHTRNALRDLMEVNTEYNIATEAYQNVIRLQRRGVGQEILRMAQDPAGADVVASLLNPKKPASAATVRSLLLDQAAAGGQALDGQRAWNAVRSVFTYDHVIKGGIDGLDERLTTLLRDHPDFMQVILNDQSGQQVFANLRQLGEAFKVAKATAAEQLARQKAIGAAGVEEAGTVASRATTAARRSATEAVDATKQQGAARVQGARDRTAASLRDVNRQKATFKASKTNRATTVESVAADITRVGALGLGSYWGGQSLYRLLRHAPSANELLEWAAYSNYRTSLMTRALTNQLAPPAMANLLRMAASATTAGPFSTSIPPRAPRSAPSRATPTPTAARPAQ